MDREELIVKDGEYGVATHERYPVALERGQGARLFGSDEKEYIDFASGMGVNTLGYGNWHWASAIGAQAVRLQQGSNLCYSGPNTELAELLCVRAGMNAALLTDCGSEANEAMLQMARKYSFDKYGRGRGTVITLQNSFHGQTIAGLAASGRTDCHKYFFPFPDGFRYAEVNEIESVREMGGDDVCAVLIELVQRDGIVMLDQEFVHQIALLCAEKDWLLLVDEVETGAGRTGSLFAYQQYGILPDAVSFGAGLANGLPLGGVLTGEKCRGVLREGVHPRAFGGNTVSCAGAQVVLQELDDKALEEVKLKGEFMRDYLAGLRSPYVKEIRGLGLMLGLEVQETSAGELAKKLEAAGLLTLTAGEDVLCLLPPLTVSKDEIIAGLSILQRVLKEA